MEAGSISRTRPNRLRYTPTPHLQGTARPLGSVAFSPGASRFNGRDVQAKRRRRRHQARRPPLAKIRPGRPAPAMGPGTISPVSEKDALKVGGLVPSTTSVPTRNQSGCKASRKRLKTKVAQQQGREMIISIRPAEKRICRGYRAGESYDSDCRTLSSRPTVNISASLCSYQSRSQSVA
jgi:hypothetical protein